MGVAGAYSSACAEAIAATAPGPSNPRPRPVWRPSVPNLPLLTSSPLSKKKPEKHEVGLAGCHHPGAEPYANFGWQRRLPLTYLSRRVRGLLRKFHVTRHSGCLLSRPPRDRQLCLFRGLTSPASTSRRYIDRAPVPPVASGLPARSMRHDSRAPPPESSPTRGEQRNLAGQGC